MAVFTTGLYADTELKLLSRLIYLPNWAHDLF